MTYRLIKRSRSDTLGEGPTWVSERDELLWVDIMRPAVHRMNLSNGRIVTLDVDEAIGWIIPIAGDTRLMAGFRSGFWLLDIESGARELVGSPELDRPDNRLNDAKVDRWGRIWAGSKDDTDRAASGALYRLGPDLKWQRMDDGYGVTNGPAFSIDGKILYHTDSAARTIFAFDVAENGSLSGKRIWLKFPEEWGHPDGMTTDVESCLWVAHWGGGRVSRFSPSGELLNAIALPATNITSCCFAGPKHDRLFVTSSTIGCEAEEHAGALFEVETGTSGSRPTSFGPIVEAD